MSRGISSPSIPDHARKQSLSRVAEYAIPGRLRGRWPWVIRARTARHLPGLKVWFYLVGIGVTMAAPSAGFLLAVFCIYSAGTARVTSTMRSAPAHHRPAAISGGRLSPKNKKTIIFTLSTIVLQGAVRPEAPVQFYAALVLWPIAGRPRLGTGDGAGPGALGGSAPRATGIVDHAPSLYGRRGHRVLGRFLRYVVPPVATTPGRCRACRGATLIVPHLSYLLTVSVQHLFNDLISA